MDLTQYRRRATTQVRIGGVVIGGGRPVAVQSMTNTDTNDTEASAAQVVRIARAGARIVRLTAQGPREAENLRHIARRVRELGCDAALVADIHFLPEAAGKEGVRYAPRCGVALEAQGFPNAVNQPVFPSAVLRAGERYRQEIAFAFGHD